MAPHSDTKTTAIHQAKPTRQFVFDVDGVTYEYDHHKITGARIMALAGINPSVGLVQCFDDGSQETIKPDDVVELVPQPWFRKRPRFKRG